VRIIGGKYKGQTATLERHWPGGGKEWTVTLDGSYNNGIVKDDEIVSIKAKDSAVGEGETTYKGYTIRSGDDYAIYFRPGDIERMQIAGSVEQAKKFIDQMVARGKDAACIQCVKTAKLGEHFCGGKCEAAWLAKKYLEDWADMQKRGGSLHGKAHDYQMVIEKYKGYEIERGETGAVRVVGLGRRYAQYFNAYSEAKAIEKAKAAIDREVAKPPAQPVKPEDLIISLNDLPKRIKAHDSSAAERDLEKQRDTKAWALRHGSWTTAQENRLKDAEKRVETLRAKGRIKDASWGSAALMPMNYRKAAETAKSGARAHRVEGKRISNAKGSLKPEFTAAAQAHYTAAGCWDDIVNALKQRSDAGEEAAESLWGSAVRQGQKAELLTAQLGIVTKAYDSLSFNTLFWAGIIAALIAKHYGPKETVGMGSYDLRNYQPERKTW
jgi:hypothetical protein